MMGPLIERPHIQQDFQTKYPTLLSMYEQELDQAKVLYDRQQALAQSPAGPEINKNMPYVAGLLKWSQGLWERVAGGMERIKMLNIR